MTNEKENGIWYFIKANRFFEAYAPNVKDYVHKVRGTNWRGNPCKFTPQDMVEIKKGIREMIKEKV